MEVGRVPGGSLRHRGRPRYAAAAGDVSMRVEGEGCDDDLGAPVAGVASQGSGSVADFFSETVFLTSSKLHITLIYRRGIPSVCQ